MILEISHYHRLGDRVVSAAHRRFIVGRRGGRRRRGRRGGPHRFLHELATVRLRVLGSEGSGHGLGLASRLPGRRNRRRGLRGIAVAVVAVVVVVAAAAAVDAVLPLVLGRRVQQKLASRSCAAAAMQVRVDASPYLRP
jgi:hypothetical protein